MISSAQYPDDTRQTGFIDLQLCEELCGITHYGDN